MEDATARRTRVAVLGAGGRMGREVCLAVGGDPSLELVAAVDPQLEGTVLDSLLGTETLPIAVAGGIEALAAAGAEVAVDFTVASAAADNLRWCAAHGVHAVVGTSGIPPAVLEELSRAFEASEANCVVAANFAIGAVLMVRMAELAAPYMDGVEIVELHHGAKRDAPSATALDTAERVEHARRRSGAAPWAADPTTDVVAEGARGAEGPGGLRVHSVRLPGLVAHQEVIFGARGQSLSIRHDAYDRSSFMPGVLLAVKQVAGRRGLTVGLDALLGL